MIFNLKNFLKIVKKNNELVFLILLIFTAVVSTQFYNHQKQITNKSYKSVINNVYFEKSMEHIFNNLTPRYTTVNHKILKNETFDKILNIYFIPQDEIEEIKKELRKDINLNNLKTNQVIKFTIDRFKNKKIKYFLYPISRTEKVELVRRLDTDIFKKKTIITNLNKKIVFKEGKILESLYKTASDLGVPPNIIIEYARIYGFQVDFQRDIKKNDNFQIMFEIFEDDNGKIFETGNVIFANLRLSGVNNRLYYFDVKGSRGYYNKNGKSVKKALMKTPINGARLSSKFGMRKHPIDGYNKMHRGTDFAAAQGTPIMASGDGIVTRAKWCGGGGNCIKIKHNSTYQTVYAHMLKFALGIKSGVRVRQGQVIGYVGSTGKSTGPHLHYEVIMNGKKINSQTLKLPSGRSLKNNERKLFEVNKIKLDVLKSELIMGLN